MYDLSTTRQTSGADRYRPWPERAEPRTGRLPCSPNRHTFRRHRPPHFTIHGYAADLPARVPVLAFAQSSLTLSQRGAIPPLTLAHNHPSGVAEPSQADELITRRLKDALALVDIRVLDHLVIAGGEVLSLAERGLL